MTGDPAVVVLILCFLFSLYLLVLSWVCCSSCGCRRTERARRAAARARRNAPALTPPWRPRSVELTPPVAMPPVEPWSMTSVVGATTVRKKLGCFPYSAAGVEGCRRAAAGVCAICLEAFVHGAACSEVPACRHLFHRDCIELWTRCKSTCPMCRGAIVPGSQRLSAADDMV